VHWLGLWSDRPYMVSECDFNALIGPRLFQRLFLPDIARRAAAVGRAVFHLDGPDAVRHIDALLATPEIQAIQFTPGAGTSSALAQAPMLRKVQASGRPVLVICPAREVLDLCDVLRPEGLGILLDESLTPAELDDLYGRLCRRFGV
jgi:hypothetical protein